MIYVILGMHKSGTTLLSELLHFSGINMGSFDEKISYDDGNHYERSDTKNVNKLLLDSKGRTSLLTNKVPNRLKIDMELQDRILKIVDDLNGKYQNWGFKDPRTVLTYNIWKPLLKEHKIIAIFRSANELWSHYRSRCKKYNFLKKIFFCWLSIKAWYVYNSNIISHLKETDSHNFLVVNFSDLILSSNGLNNLKKFTGLEIYDRRKPFLYRRKITPSFLFTFFFYIQKIFFFRNCDYVLYKLNRLSTKK